jgi:BCCT family betaine/carnitine transporter
VYLATTIDSSAYVLAGSTTKLLDETKDPARWNRIFWAVVFCLLSIGIMIIDGFEIIKLVSVIAGIPLVVVVFVVMFSVKRLLENDGKERL